MEKNYRIKLLFIFLFILIINGSLIGQDIDQYFVSDSMACDTFPPPRNLDGYTQDDAALLWWEPPQMLPTDKSFNPEGVNSKVKTVNVSELANRDSWDIQMQFQCGGSSEYGAETDRNYIYTSTGTSMGGVFYEYELDGTFNGSYTIPNCSGFYDMASMHDYGGLIYGGNGGNKIFGINFNNGAIEDSIVIASNCRSIAFDEQQFGFWVNDWDSDIFLYDLNGSLITSFPLTGIQNISGLAHDPWSSPEDPCLWGFSGEGSTATLVQIDINSAGSIIFSMDITPLIGGSSAPGGLFTECNLYELEKASIGGIRQGETIFSLELGDCMGPPIAGPFVPQNLIGYNIYRDNELLEYIPYDGSDTTFFWDMNIWWQGCYDYHTTALYSLDSCGFPGDTAESPGSNIKEICIEYCSCFPFYEEWNTGSFDPNLWTAEENWSVDPVYGYPPPTAIFNGSQIDSSYAFQLTSYGHDIKYHPGTEDPYIDGDIFLEYDIKLNDLDTCGIDRLKVMYTDTSMQYQLITGYSDSLGSFPWKHEKLNLTSELKWKQVKIAFLAEGEGGSVININNWYIDNIKLYRQCNPPRELQWVIENQIMAWRPPIPHTEVKKKGTKEFLGYNIYYYDSGYEFLDFTTDTFYTLIQSYDAYYVTAVYEDCEPASNELIGHVGIEDKQGETSVSIFPNPANNTLGISTSVAISKLSVIELNGRIMMEKEDIQQQYQLNTSNLPNGIYILEVMLEKEVLRKKFVVKH